MAFTFEDMIIDRVIDGVFRDSESNVIAGLNQVQNLSIATSSETKDKTDAQGVLIKRFYTAKSVEVSAENAVVSLSLMGLQTGSGKIVGSSDKKVTLPRIIKYAKGDSPITLKETPIEGTISVVGLTATGVPDTTLNYELADEAGAGAYALAGKVLNLPTDAADFVQVMYMYEAENAVKVLQTSDKFPAECELTLSVLVCDSCDKETLRHAYIVFPAFQMSPDFDLSVATDSAHPFSGVAAVDYCSADKSMFYIAISEDDAE